MVDVYKIQTKRETIQFEIEGVIIEKTLKPLKNKQLIEIQELSQKTQKLDTLSGKINPKTAQIYTDEEINESAKGYETRIKEILLKESTTPPFSDKELDEIETPTLLEISNRILILNGLEEMLALDKKKRELSQTQPSQDTLKRGISKDIELLNRNPRVTLS